jgi:hypothetical protein
MSIPEWILALVGAIALFSLIAVLIAIWFVHKHTNTPP